MATTIGTAYAVPTNLCPTGSTTQFVVQYTCVVQDGVQQAIQFINDFLYDATQTPAANLASFKAVIAAFALTLGFTVDASSILIFTAVS